MNDRIQVSLPTARAAAHLGASVLQYAFLKRGKHNTYWVLTDGLSDEQIVFLGGTLEKATPAPEIIVVPAKRNQTTRRSSITRDMMLEVHDVERYYKPESRRLAVYTFLRTMVGKRIRRGTLVEFIVAATPFGPEVIDPALSHFIHETGIITVVE